MDMIHEQPSDLGYFTQAPVLIAASSNAAMDRARRTVEASGLRIGAALPIEGARERIELQASATAVWIEIDRDCGKPLDALVESVDRDVSAGRYAAVLSMTSDLLDLFGFKTDDRDVQLAVDADDAERAAALAIATASTGLPIRVSDIAADQNADRLRQLSEEVSRIASTLARLSTGPSSAARPVIEPVHGDDLPPLSADTVRAVIRARRLRSRFFPELQAEISHLRVPVSSLCIAAAVPATTALRWLKTLASEGLFVRRADPHDGRRVFVELAPEASQALRRYFAEVGPLVAI